MKDRGEEKKAEGTVSAEPEPKLRPVAVAFARAMRAIDEATIPSSEPAPAAFVTSTGAKIDLT